MRSIRAAGFTLVELVTVMVLLGILAIGVSSFLIFGSRIFFDSSEIDRIIGSSRYAMERMTRELRNAVPGSIRLADNGSVQCIEFVPIAESGSYLEMPFEHAAKNGKVFTPSTPLQVGWQLFIYPLPPSYVNDSNHPSSPSDVYDSNRHKRVSIESTVVTGETTQIIFSHALQFAEASPAKRFYVADSPVSYCFFANSSNGNGGELRRYQDYGYFPEQQMMNIDNGVLMAEHLANNFSQQLPITIAPASLTNNAIVQLSPRFKVNSDSFTYQHQVQVFNVP